MTTTVQWEHSLLDTGLGKIVRQIYLGSGPTWRLIHPSGVMTFLVSRDGMVLQKDLGTETAKVASEIKEYNPDKTWVKAE